MPLIRAETLRKLIEHHGATAAACTILGVRLENPTGYGRIIRDERDAFKKIVEQRDATDEERQVKEINSGIYAFDAAGVTVYVAGVVRSDEAQDQNVAYVHLDFLQRATGDVVIVATVDTIAPAGDIREFAVKLFENRHLVTEF